MPNNHGCITLDQFGPSDSISDLGLVVRGDLGVTPDGSQIQIFLFLGVSDKKGKNYHYVGSLMFLDKPSRFGPIHEVPEPAVKTKTSENYIEPNF